MTQKIKWIESLRGISCLIVLFAHILSVHPRYGIYASGCGKIGVWIFMLLSGMLLIKPDNMNSVNLQLKQIPKYYLNKLLKLYPAYFLTVLLIYMLNFIDRSNLFSVLTFQGSWGHLWYMPVIIKFYIISPVFILLVCFLKRLQQTHWHYLYGGVLCILSIIFIFAYPYNTYVENSISLKWYIPVFIFGLLISLLLSKIKEQKKSFVFDLSAILCIVLVVLQTPLAREVIFNITPSKYLQNKYLTLGLLFALFIIFTSKSNITKTILDKSILLQKTGEYSFYIYLVHYPILLKLNSICPSFKLCAGLTIVASIGSAIILHYICSKVLILYHSLTNKQAS